MKVLVDEPLPKGVGGEGVGGGEVCAKSVRHIGGETWPLSKVTDFWSYPRTPACVTVSSSKSVQKVTLARGPV